MKHLLAIAFIAFGLAPSLHAQTQEVPLRVGDTVGIKISGIAPEEVAQISQVYRISDQGTINLLYLNEVNAAGMKPSDLERKIATLYKEKEIYTHPSITVSTDMGPEGRTISVGGAVLKGGPQPFRPGLTAGEAMDAAGPTPFTKLKETKLIRSGKEYKLDLRKASNPDSQMLLQPGDRVVATD